MRDYLKPFLLISAFVLIKAGFYKVCFLLSMDNIFIFLCFIINFEYIFKKKKNSAWHLLGIKWTSQLDASLLD